MTTERQTEMTPDGLQNWFDGITETLKRTQKALEDSQEHPQRLLNSAEDLSDEVSNALYILNLLRLHLEKGQREMTTGRPDLQERLDEVTKIREEWFHRLETTLNQTHEFLDSLDSETLGSFDNLTDQVAIALILLRQLYSMWDAARLPQV